MSSDNNIIIFDTTLRDGEQSPGFSMSCNQKVEMAVQLERLGVDIIEAGFPISSKGDWDAVNQIAKTLKTPIVTGLARAKTKDIDAVVSAISIAQRPRIHTFISTSDMHIIHKLKISHDDVIDAIDMSVKYARRFADDVQWSAEDASRTDIDFLCRAVETAIKAGATTLNLPDTVGYAMPHDYADMFHQIISRVPNADQVVFSAHCHNDLGVAVANSLSALHVGVNQIECTINGIGERAGNAAMEEVIMAIKTRSDIHPFNVSINTKELMPTSQCLAKITGVNVQPNKAIVGKNAFAHASGIHQDGILKNPLTYEVMKPEDVGVNGTSLVISKHSGMHAIEDKLSHLGFQSFSKGDMRAIYNKIMRHCDQNNGIDNPQIVKIVQSYTP